MTSDTTKPYEKVYLKIIRKDEKMTFPQDHLQESVKAEEHSIVSIVIVSSVMIGAAMISLIVSL